MVDDHMLFRESLRRLLDGETGIHVVGDYSSSENVLQALRRGLRFDVALLDYDLGPPERNGSSGLDLARQIRAVSPDAGILMVTAGMDTTLLRQAIKQLGVGVFLKTEPTGELLLAIQKTMRGEQWISSRASLALLSEQVGQKSDSEERGDFNERESRVLQAVLEGKTNKEIGAQIGLSESAVKAVLQRLFEKTGVRSRSQLVRYAIESRGARRE
ncbi:response regulator transcription factor [Granulicella sp. 5B5]|uniref:LuxR C-terminal-related transcriptional regulator n=1 Tax=Granulicella sp. 5B5 TaxID=1617967 RepID=UPI0015F62D83|nr:response regulator transcription factor [Granulicella sp. 5B5]